MDLVLASSTVVHGIYVLVAAAALEAARLLELLDRFRTGGRDAVFLGPLAEAEAWLSADREGFARAADLYASLELPYQEARSALEAGQAERAGEIIRRFGLEDGPLGARLQQLRREVP
jgi:hypothetical protein